MCFFISIYLDWLKEMPLLNVPMFQCTIFIIPLEIILFYLSIKKVKTQLKPISLLTDVGTSVKDLIYIEDIA